MPSQLSENLHTFIEVIEEFPELRLIGDRILRESTQEVSIEEGKVIGEKLGKILVQYREKIGYGRGLAAPQLGINASVFVTFVENNIQIFINPKIIDHSEKTNFYRELCLSTGILSADVERHESVTLEWTTVEGEKRRETFDGFMARLIQHEEAHLRGKVNIDEAYSGGVEFLTFDPLKEQLRENK